MVTGNLYIKRGGWFPRERANILSYLDITNRIRGKHKHWGKEWQCRWTPIQRLWPDQELCLAGLLKGSSLAAFFLGLGRGWKELLFFGVPYSFSLARTASLLSFHSYQPILEPLKEDWFSFLAATWQPLATTRKFKLLVCFKRNSRGKNKREKRYPALRWLGRCLWSLSIEDKRCTWAGQTGFGKGHWLESTVSKSLWVWWLQLAMHLARLRLNIVASAPSLVFIIFHLEKYP